jgi:uncharacterized glyoxalase superfamily metalloenzyme YdcJ
MSWLSPNQIRAQFAALMSAMYQQEVPLYGDLLSLVAQINTLTLAQHPDLKQQLESTGQLPRLSEERHGAIRLGTATELFNMRRIFAVMGMYPVGYYDLVPAGVPVHATAFRALSTEDLNASPFRVFTSLLRLELIAQPQLRQLAEQTLSQRQIFTATALALTEKFEQQGGLDAVDADRFVHEVLNTFRWHHDAAVDQTLYQNLLAQHRLVADVVAFKGPHINHLTPRTLNIDAVQAAMFANGIEAKAVIEGPPARHCPILLRQTSFKALQEQVNFVSADGCETGSHSARFGEIEQRGIALTHKGRQLYDQLLAQARAQLAAPPDAGNAEQYMQLLQQSFQAFPDTYPELYAQGLAYFYFIAVKTVADPAPEHLEQWLKDGSVRLEPIIYEDFLPVSAAGIFQSNLGDAAQAAYPQHSNQEVFQQALGTAVFDEMQLYAKMQAQSLTECLSQLARGLSAPSQTIPS